MLTIHTGEDWIGLIVLSPSGMWYQHQAGGYACRPLNARGAFAPLPSRGDASLKRVAEDLTAHFAGPKWGGWCQEGIDAETADLVDHLLAGLQGCRPITVDRTRLPDSCEAWVYVTVGASAQEYDWDSFGGAGAFNAIFIWPNSD